MTSSPISGDIAVLGAGAMGSGIAQVAVRAGHRVLVYDALAGAADRARDRILKSLASLVEKGRLDQQELNAIKLRLCVVQSLPQISGAKLVIEAVIEDLAVKQDLFREVEAVVGPDTILATNTSSISITSIASRLADPGRLAGLHFFNPAPIMRLVEVVSGLATRPEVMETLALTARAWGKIAVTARSTPGFIVNRVARPYYSEALRLLEEGAAPAEVLDRIYRECGGFRMGPFELMDMIGHDVNFAVTSEVYAGFFQDARYRPSVTQRELLSAGWLGQKSGRGFYQYPRQNAPAPVVESVSGDSGPTEAAFEGDALHFAEIRSLCEGSGVRCTQRNGAGLIAIDGARLAPTDGRTATERMAAGEGSDLVLYDHCLDFVASKSVVIAGAKDAQALAAVTAFFDKLGKQVIAVEDMPGLVVHRTVAMLVDEAVDALQTGIASAGDIEVAVTTGVNYPCGLLEWGDRIGASRLVAILDRLRETTGDNRYRVSGLLRRLAAANAGLAPDTQLPK